MLFLVSVGGNIVIVSVIFIVIVSGVNGPLLSLLQSSTVSALVVQSCCHHELPASSSLRQQLRGQPAQRLHDGPAAPVPLPDTVSLRTPQKLHQFPGIPSHGEKAAAGRVTPAPGFRPSLLFFHLHTPQWRLCDWRLPQLLLQCGEDGADRQRRAGQGCGTGGASRRNGCCARASAQTSRPQAKSPAGHRRPPHRLVRDTLHLCCHHHTHKVMPGCSG